MPATLEAEEVNKLKDLQSIRALAPSDAAGKLVDFEATITYVNEMREFIFVQDGQEAIFVYRPEAGELKAGQRVRIEGVLAKGDLLPIVSNPVVSVLVNGKLPQPEKIAKIDVEHDCRYLEFEFDILQTSVRLRDTLLYAKTDSGMDVIIQVLRPDATHLKGISRLAGHRVKCTGVLGLQIAGGAFVEPGMTENKIVGYKIFCNSPDAIKFSNPKKMSALAPAKRVPLLSLKKGDLEDGRFQTFAQVCMVEKTEPRSMIVCDESTFMKLNLQSVHNLQPGRLLGIRGTKSTDEFGKPHFHITNLFNLALAEFSQPASMSVERAVETFTLNKRITVEGTPLRVEQRDGQSYLILGGDNSTIAVRFQENAMEVFPALNPSKASKVQVTGVSQKDDHNDFQLVVVRPIDAMVVQSRTHLSRNVAIGLVILSILGGLAALWIKLLKNKVSQKQRFESIFDNAGCPIMVFNGDLRIVDANQLAADMTGFSKDELRTMYVDHIDMNMPRHKIIKMLERAMDSQEIAVFRTKVQGRDNRSQDVEVHCRNLTVSNDPMKATYIAIFPDISAQNEYENQLKKARDEAIEANEAKSRFLAAMSHELRTPLNGVIGMTQLLEGTELTPIQTDYLSACRTSGETLLTVIGDVLDFSKMEAGKLKLETRETELISFIENIVRATSLQQKTEQIDLASFVDPRLSRPVMVDSDRFRQVMFNLIGNAVKFTSQGCITVTAKCSEVTSHYADVKFVVADTGIGIPEDRIASLFEAFEQCDSSTTREYGGTGLGLAICKQIIDLMDGKIHIESAEGVGSKFTVEVRLPFAAIDDENRQTNIGIDEGSEQPRVAVMGMSNPISKLLHETFVAYKVDASFFGKYEVLPEDKFDVILLNNDGDPDAIGEMLAKQTSLVSDDAAIVIPVIPANCVLQPSQWKSLGTQNPLHRPFSQTRLLQALKLGRGYDEKPRVVSSPLAQVQDRVLRILLCEDTPVNQMFVKEVCRNAGIKCCVCDNGKTAIDTLQRDAQFDVIFMDCQMPVMDGFEATRLIREMSDNDLIPRIPIVALTANAVVGDRDKCLAAGMDDYLAKPFEINQFLNLIHTHAATSLETRRKMQLDTHDKIKSKAPIFDNATLLDQINDQVFVMEIAQQFAESLPSYKTDLENCLQNQDTVEAISVTHRLKGSAGTVKAERISNLAMEMESAVREGQLDQFEMQIVEMLKEFENFANVVRSESPDSCPN
ncbi:ATP-binding protein [bacterium]|nr:ATP-binding protein [bacterium]